MRCISPTAEDVVPGCEVCAVTADKDGENVELVGRHWTQTK